jgi:threonylcarbamoyladenosine tRNA methylthiotransferase MtaB
MSSKDQVVTFGCRLNIFESQVIQDNLIKSGLTDVIVVNTCAVTNEAEKQGLQEIRKLHRQNPDKKIIVTGCSAQVHPELFTDMPEIYKILGNQEKMKLSSYNFDESQGNIISSDIMNAKEGASHLVQHFDKKTRAFIEIQNGCNHRCTFCIIPFARGNNRSVPIAQIVQQINSLVDKGYKEVIFTGVDITDYGADLPGKPSLAGLVKRVLSLVPNLARLRLSSIDVAEIDSDLFDLMANEQRLMPHFHISVQAGDDMILKRMKRRHNRNQIVEFCHELRKARPNVSFGADIIAGFPTENDEMFQNTYKLIEEASIQFLHVFPYSEREGTPAARMPQVEIDIRKRRASILRKAGQLELTNFLHKMLHQKSLTLLEKVNFGHSANFLSTKLVNDHSCSNEIVNVEFIGVNNNMMIGKIV